MLAGRLLGSMDDIEPSRAEGPVDTHWTVKVMGASTCPSCGVDHAR